jgi:hypothetical protein
MFHEVELTKVDMELERSYILEPSGTSSRVDEERPLGIAQRAHRASKRDARDVLSYIPSLSHHNIMSVPTVSVDFNFNRFSSL